MAGASSEEATANISKSHLTPAQQRKSPERIVTYFGYSKSPNDTVI